MFQWKQRGMLREFTGSEPLIERFGRLPLRTMTVSFFLLLPCEGSPYSRVREVFTGMSNCAQHERQQPHTKSNSVTDLFEIFRMACRVNIWCDLIDSRQRMHDDRVPLSLD